MDIFSINPIITIQPEPKIYPPIKLPNEKKRRRIVRTVNTYGVLIKRHGKYKPVVTNLTKGQAIAYEQRYLLGSIARSGKIVSTGRTKEIFGLDDGDNIINQTKFRQYKVKSGKIIPLEFGNIIQLTKANIQSFGEKEDLRIAKQMKKQNLYF